MAKSKTNTKEFFELKLKGWLNCYYPAVLDKDYETQKLAMREGVQNIYPIANDRAKEDRYGDLIEEITDHIAIIPENYIVQFSSFFELVRLIHEDGFKEPPTEPIVSQEPGVSEAEVM